MKGTAVMNIFVFNHNCLFPFVYILFLMFISFKEMDEWYKSNFFDLNQTSAKHIGNMRSSREELAKYKKNVSRH